MEQRVTVPRQLAEQLERIRSEGRTNMFDFNTVQHIASEYDYAELVVWMEDHRREWGSVILHGFDVTEDEV